MHYKLELILPKTETLIEDIEKILWPFKEGQEDSSHPFWDFYVIGGRFAGSKLESTLSKEKVSAFYQMLTDEEIMVKGLVSGKQEIATKEQEQKVNSIWSEMFPESGLDVCPFFKGSNNQYDSKDYLPMDICQVSEIPENYSCPRLIIAADKYNGLGAEFMISTDFWNGVTWVDTSWNGNVKDGIAMFFDKISNYKDEYKTKFDFDKFISVTIDYHS